jgi:hypothetical protein
MNFDEFITRVIDRGIKSVSADEMITEHPKRLKGSLDGFEACRGKDPVQLALLYSDAERKALALREVEDIEDYWQARYFAIQVEFVCNTASAVLMNQGLPVIIPPTAKGAMNAAKIVGVSEA